MTQKQSPLRQPMEIVVPSEGSGYSYPEVSPGASRWCWSDEPTMGTVLVTEHGLRRLLRLASRAWGIANYARIKSLPQEHQDKLREIYGDKIFDSMYQRDIEKVEDFLDECSTIFCEGDLVMSRLFVVDGKVIAHPDEEVDAAGIPPHG